MERAGRPSRAAAASGADAVVARGGPLNRARAAATHCSDTATIRPWFNPSRTHACAIAATAAAAAPSNHAHKKPHQQVVVQRLLAPHDRLGLVGVRVGEAGRGARDAAKEAAQVGALWCVVWERGRERLVYSACLAERSGAPRRMAPPTRPTRALRGSVTSLQSHRAARRGPCCPACRHKLRTQPKPLARVAHTNARTCLWPPPFSATWHWAHLVLKIFSPRARSPGGASAKLAIALGLGMEPPLGMRKGLRVVLCVRG